MQAVDNTTLALAAITQNKPDAILLDVRLPEVDDLSVLKSLREMEVRAPIFVMTGYDSTPVAIEARARCDHLSAEAL